MASIATDDRSRPLEDALTALEGTAFPFGIRTVQDAQARESYRAAIREAADEIRAQVKSGKMTPSQGAAQAQAMRNEIMAMTRDHTSEFGRAWAESIKKTGKTFEELIEIYAQRLFTKPAAALTAVERDSVMHEIIAAAARDNAKVTGMLRFLGPASRGLMALTIGLAIYDIYKAPDRPKEALHQGIVIGSGVAGSYIAASAAGSLVCGPGAPVCLGVLIVVGGISFSLGADYFWRRGQAGDGDK